MADSWKRATSLRIKLSISTDRHVQVYTSMFLSKTAFGALTLLVGRQEEWWDARVVICLERGADCLHMVQLTPLPSQNTVIS